MADNNDIQGILAPELHGERLLWCGRPSASRALRTWPSRAVFVFGVIWTAFCLTVPYLFGENEMFLFLIPFILIGLALLLSPIWYYRDAKRTIYGITDKRVLIVVNRRTRDVESFGPTDIGGIKVKDLGAGLGDIRIGWRPYRGDFNEERWTEVTLVGIPEARAVEKLLRDVFESQPDAA
jgi:hypothetical protein